MKIVVIGASGLIGSNVAAKLEEHGHEVVPASPNSGVNTLTGEGLADAMQGAHGRRRRVELAVVRGRGRHGVLRDVHAQPPRRREGGGGRAPRRAVGRRGRAHARQRLPAREVPAGGAHQGLRGPVLDHPRDAVLRVRGADRRRGDRRRHGADPAGPVPAHRGGGRRPRRGQDRGRRAAERRRRDRRDPSSSASTSSSATPSPRRATRARWSSTRTRATSAPRSPSAASCRATAPGWARSASRTGCASPPLRGRRRAGTTVHQPEQLIATAVLVVGTGGSGLRAAIELAEAGVDVLAVGKRPRADAHTALAAGGINAALATDRSAGHVAAARGRHAQGGLPPGRSAHRADRHAGCGTGHRGPRSLRDAVRARAGRADLTALLRRAHLPPHRVRRRLHRPGDPARPRAPRRAAAGADPRHRLHHASSSCATTSSSAPTASTSATAPATSSTPTR